MHSRFSVLRRLVAALAFAALLGACGASSGEVTTDASSGSASDSAPTESSESASSDADAPSDPAPTDPAPESDADVEDVIGDDALESIDDLADDLESLQEAVGGGEATLTVGDQTWTFSPVLCAFGEEEIRQEGAEFVMSALQDGAQMYVSIDSFGHSVSLNDIENFEDPSVSLSSDFGAGDFLTVNGKDFSGTAEFLDDTSDSFETVTGTISGTCP